MITVNNVQNANSERYEFRIELSCGSSCHCVAPQGTFGLVNQWSNGVALCNDSTSSPSYALCASSFRNVFYVTKPFAITDGTVTENTDSCNQHSNTVSGYNTTFCPDGNESSISVTNSCAIEPSADPSFSPSTYSSSSIQTSSTSSLPTSATPLAHQCYILVHQCYILAHQCYTLAHQCYILAHQC